MTNQYTAENFVAKITTLADPKKAEGYDKAFKISKEFHNGDDMFIGVRMGNTFALAKEFKDMDAVEIEKLLESSIHEVRAGAVRIMDFRARHKKTPQEDRKQLYDLYLRRHDRINNWDLVDRSAIYVIGGYLIDKPGDILYKLAKSSYIWERRTAIVATAYFMKKGEIDDTLKIAELLLNDTQDLIHKATGWMLRVAGDIDNKALVSFLEKHAATMPRVALRYSLKHFPKDERTYFLKKKEARATSSE